MWVSLPAVSRLYFSPRPFLPMFESAKISMREAAEW